MVQRLAAGAVAVARRRTERIGCVHDGSFPGERKTGGRISPAAGLQDLSRFQIDGLAAARVRLDVEGDLVAFVERAHARRFDGRGMDEYVLAAAFRSDEAEAFCGVEELDCTDCHFIFLT